MIALNIPYVGDISAALEYALIAVGVLIGIMGIIALITGIALSIKYVKFNKWENSRGLTGEEVARTILDRHGLGHIEVKVTGSIMFGNSYSHYFKKVRLRRFTRHKTSLTAMAMGAQKASLAVLDAEGEPSMKRRIRLVPLITFGPFAFIPLILVGVVVDIFFFGANGYAAIALAAISLLFYLASLVLSVATLSTEKRAEERACQLLESDGLATGDEIRAIRELYHLYNVQYVNDIIISTLELIYRAIEIVLAITGKDD